MRDLRIRTTVVIREVLTPRTCRAELRNGKVIFAYGEPGDSVPPLVAGARCSVLLSLCDFSEGRIVPEHADPSATGHRIIEGDPAA